MENQTDKANQICRTWVAKLGLGFHPDTRGKDYSPPLSKSDIAAYDSDMDALFALAPDPYAIALNAMRFEQWRATRKPCADLGVEYSDEILQGKAGFVYEPGYIEQASPEDAKRFGGEYYVLVERDEYYGNLAGAESFLWDHYTQYELGAHASPPPIAPDMEQLHACARAFMDAHKRKGWQDCSLDEWMHAYREFLPPDVARAGDAILALF